MTPTLVSTLIQIGLIAASVFAGLMLIAALTWLPFVVRTVRTSERLRRLTRPIWTGHALQRRPLCEI